MNSELQSTNESLAAENAQLQLHLANLLPVLAQCADALAYAAYNIDGSKLEDLRPGIIESTGSAEAALIAERDAREALGALRSLTQGAGQPQHLPVQAEKPEEVMDESNGYRLTYDALEALYFAQCSLTDELTGKLAEGSDKALQARIAELESDLGAMNRKYMALNTATPCPPSSAQGTDNLLAINKAAQFERMFMAACEALGLINEALGLDPDDGGAEPILDAIAELKEQVAALPSSAPIEEREATVSGISVPELPKFDPTMSYPSPREVWDHAVLTGYRAALSAPAIPEGMPETQEPKYGIRDNRLYNRASGEFIPEDEPVFIFRARDSQAAAAIFNYAGYFAHNVDTRHYRAVMCRFDAFRNFAHEHRDRMKFPDTEFTAAPIPASPKTEEVK